MNIFIYMHPRSVRPKKEKVTFNPHDMKKEKSDAYCNLCLKKGVEYVCASVDHDRIHRPIGGFHLCASCFEKLGLRKLS